MTVDDRPLDTAPEAQRAQIDLFRRMTAVDKLRCIRDLSLAADTVALAGLRSRHPHLDRPELLLRLAVLRYGRDM
jgi:hypothetical protein